MVEHDGMVGQILDKLHELGLDENTIVMYSTDNGAEKFTWPDGGTSPFRGEKNENWEGSYRIPCAIRWPAISNLARSPTRSSAVTTGSRRSSPPPEMPM